MDPVYAWIYYIVLAISIATTIMNEVTRRRMKKTNALLDTALNECELAYANAIRVSVETANEAERRRRS